MSRLAWLGTAASVLAATALLGVPSGSASSGYGIGDPGFVVAPAPAGLPDADGAGEPSVGANWRTGSGLYMAYASTYKLRLNTSDSPPSVEWTDISSPYSLFNLDPIMATDARSGTTIAGGDTGSCSVMSVTRDDGESWSLAVPCTGVVDHPTVGVGPFVGGSPPPGGSGKAVAYYCQQYPVLNQCSRSIDGGQTWSPGQTITGCIGLFGHIRAGYDGTAYGPSGSCFSGGVALSGASLVGGFRSRDNGLTWDSWTIPGAKSPGRGFDPSVAIGTDNRLWETWSRDGDWAPVVASSADSGETWGSVMDLSQTVSPPLTASTFTTMLAGSPGRAAVAFLGTRSDSTANPFDPGHPDIVWDLYVSTTYDGGQHWTTTQVTKDPVQRGGINDGGVSADTYRNLLDFMDAAVLRDGRIYVGFADGCINACARDAGSGPPEDDYATVAIQSSGQGLFNETDLQHIRAGTGFAAR